MHLLFYSIIAKPPLYVSPMGEVDNNYICTTSMKSIAIIIKYTYQKKKKSSYVLVSWDSNLHLVLGGVLEWVLQDTTKLKFTWSYFHLNIFLYQLSQGDIYIYIYIYSFILYKFTSIYFCICMNLHVHTYVNGYIYVYV